MGIFKDKVESYKGQVITTYSHYWLDGMEEERAVCWNPETHEVFSIQIGYYGIDGCNLCGMSATLDLSVENYKDILNTFRTGAEKAYTEYLDERQNEVCKGRICEVIRGKKIPKGTTLKVFWCGEKPTYRSRGYSWMHETETIAGCYDENENKVWIKAEYLKPTDILETPTEEEKSSWIKNYIIKRLDDIDLPYTEI